ncbi:MAG TPA: glycosyltransferase family 39 protein [Rhizomicrobium sp.]|nr:glycosyltransferase family 39 protein [Rhizomicrobium sp.]
MRAALRHPLFWILAAAAGLRLAGLFWGLPASDGWDDDGFVPRNFLTALALTYKSGSYFTYPPLHAILLALLMAPGIVLALLQAPSFHQADVIGEFTKPAYMTFFAIIGRLVSLVMSLGIIWAVGEMARLAAGRRAGLFAAGAAALSFGLTYYGQVGNLDVPYLFWGTLALLWSMRAVAEQRPKLFWAAALFAGASIATKDQAYALFLLSLPVFLFVWLAADRWPRARVREIIRTLLPAIVAALLLVLLVDGAITNASGFARRIAFLAGPASGDYAEYLRGAAGWLALLGDMGSSFARGYGVVAMILAMSGLMLHFVRSRDGMRVAGLLPALAILSFILCFNFAALRSDDRFLLPQAVLACVYIGIAAEALAFAPGIWGRAVARVGLVVTALLALHQVVAVDAALLLDPRYDAERWMRTHIAAGDTIETYGQNCFLPRFPSYARVTRIGQGDLKLRNPLPGVTEVRAPFDQARDARFVVVNAKWALRYLRSEVPLGGGHIYSRLQQVDFHNDDARRHFAQLLAGSAGYRLAYAAHYDGPWPVVHIHDSLDETIWIFERQSSRGQS